MPKRLTLILLAAVVQGWALYGLHRVIQRSPDSNIPWLITAYVIALLIPASLQLLADHSSKPRLWIIMAAMTCILAYFGWSQHAQIDSLGAESVSPVYFIVLAVLWLMTLPFVQMYLTTGSLKIRYELLFLHSWRNKMLLAEAGLFTALFWALLLLWQSLFDMLGITFFNELFREPIFVYPVSALAFGTALYLIGSTERWLNLVLEQMLGLLKWLAVVSGFLLVLFTPFLLARFPDLVFSGQRTISAFVLLWLVAVIVLFLNAAYRDGNSGNPYPRWIAAGLQWSMPLTIAVAFAAFYALAIRIEHYGLTVERTWALVVACVALAYACGYSLSLLRRTPWMSSIGTVNASIAVALIAVLAASLTPWLSPYRLSAQSQFRMALNEEYDLSDAIKRRNSPFYYLRFDAGQYGIHKLQELAALQHHARADIIRAQAMRLLQQKERDDGEARQPVDTKSLLGTIAMFPDRRPERSLVDAVSADLDRTRDRIDDSSVGIFIDLDGDGIDEFVLLFRHFGLIYQHRSDTWTRAARTATFTARDRQAMRERLSRGDFQAETPVWRNLKIGDQVLPIQSAANDEVNQ